MIPCPFHSLCYPRPRPRVKKILKQLSRTRFFTGFVITAFSPLLSSRGKRGDLQIPYKIVILKVVLISFSFQYTDIVLSSSLQYSFLPTYFVLDNKSRALEFKIKNELRRVFLSFHYQNSIKMESQAFVVQKKVVSLNRQKY